MNLYQKSDGIWYINGINPETNKRERKSTGTTDRETAEKMMLMLQQTAITAKAIPNRDQLRTILQSLINTFVASNVFTRTPLEKAWDIYMNHEETREMKPRSVHTVSMIWNVYTRWLLDNKIDIIESISYDTNVSFIQSLRSNDKSDGTIINYRNGLHGVFDRIKRSIGLQENPWADVRAPKRPERETRRPLTMEELKQLREHLTGDWLVLFMEGYYLGCRFGNCALLKVEDFIDNYNWVEYADEKLSRYGKNHKIPVHPVFREFMLKVIGNRKSGYILPDVAKQYLKDASHLSRRFSTILRELKITATEEGMVDFHSIRHTFNTIQANAGTDADTRMKLVGHSNLKTNQIYDHAKEPMVKAIMGIPSL